MSPFAPIVQRQ